MNKLTANFRNVPASFNKRAICNISVLFDVINQAISEEIKSYMLIFAYNTEIMSIGYEIINNQIKFHKGNADGTINEFNSIEELKNNISLNNNITVLREMHILDENHDSQFIFENEDNVIEVSIGDNFMLKDYLVTSNDPNFNYNLNENQIIEYNNLILASKKNKRQVTIFLTSCVIFIIAIIIIAVIFGK